MQAPLSLHQVEGMLAYIDGADERSTWLAVGMGLKDEFGEAAFDAWDRWSQAANNYDARACRASWRGFRARPGGVTIGTVVALAKAGGYRFERTQLSAADRAEIAKRKLARESRAAAEAQSLAQRRIAAEHAALGAWKSAARDGTSEYLVRKGIQAAESVRYADGGLVVPMLRYDMPRETALKGVQTIAADGSKRFTPGMAKTGTACRLGLGVVGEPIFVCEGYATGMTLRMAMQTLTGARRWPVFVAFDAYNLPLVAEAVWRLHSQSPVFICGDDDWQTRDKHGLFHNVGALQAQIAQESVMDAGARFVVRAVPIFKPTTERGPKDTDYNDLHRLEGLDTVAAQIGTMLDCIEELRCYA